MWKPEVTVKCLSQLFSILLRQDVSLNLEIQLASFKNSIVSASPARGLKVKCRLPRMAVTWWSLSEFILMLT